MIDQKEDKFTSIDGGEFIYLLRENKFIDERQTSKSCVNSDRGIKIK